MKRIDARPIPDDRGELRVFLIVRNEALRLPSTLRHHRSLGVHRFFVIDNGSTDKTLEYLSAQPDVHVFSTTERYSQSHYGVVWANQLLDTFGTGHWTLTIDADEQFIYPHYEQVKLPVFCQYLDSIGADGAPCLLLDMYSNVAIQDTVHDPNGSLLDTCGYFDRAPYRITPSPQFPYLEIYGGVRERLFQKIRAKQHPPTISKAPLVKWKPGTKFLQSTHFLTAKKVAPILATLLHFKFLSDFHERVQIEVARGEHFADAAEYRAYFEMMRANKPVNFLCNQSVNFENSSQLVELGLMASAKSYDASVQSIIAAPPKETMAELAKAV
jgi:glycosyltransferase involved in cell wall biosynthesis